MQREESLIKERGKGNKLKSIYKNIRIRKKQRRGKERIQNLHWRRQKKLEKNNSEEEKKKNKQRDKNICKKIKKNRRRNYWKKK